MAPRASRCEDDRISVTVDLLKRYDRPGPRYTSYPTAVEFHGGFGEAEYRRRLAAAAGKPEAPLSLYVHLPFCAERCSFCGCFVIITKDNAIVERYIDLLDREAELLADALGPRRKVTQYHWGGGTPTHLGPEQMERLHRCITRHFHIEPGAEVAVEIHPRVTTREHIRTLHDLGFNRMSMGVQDFDPEVQRAADRHQTEEETRDLIDHCREIGFHSVNLDLIYGLPRQNPESYAKTLEKILEIRPDRLAVYSYAYVPWIRGNQRAIEESDLPPADVKLRLFVIAREKLLEGGYVQIGMDHFALPDDELARALEKRTLSRNFMGYTVKAAPDMVGLGVSSIADIEGAYAQNEKKLPAYERMLRGGQFPILRGYALSRDDRIRRDVITALMCNFHLEKRRIEEAWGIGFDDYFRSEMDALREPEGHGFISLGPEAIEVTGTGRLFVRNVCMIFDRYLPERERDGRPYFSRTV